MYSKYLPVAGGFNRLSWPSSWEQPRTTLVLIVCRQRVLLPGPLRVKIYIPLRLSSTRQPIYVIIYVRWRLANTFLRLVQALNIICIQVHNRFFFTLYFRKKKKKRLRSNRCDTRVTYEVLFTVFDLHLPTVDYKTSAT